MKEAIERLVAELERRRGENLVAIATYGQNPETYGRARELEFALYKLKAVLAEHGGNRSISDSCHTDGRGQDDATEQVEG